MHDRQQLIEREVLAKRHRYEYEPEAKGAQEFWIFVFLLIVYKFDDSATSGDFIVWCCVAGVFLSLWRSRETTSLSDPSIRAMILLFAIFLLGKVSYAVWERMVEEELFPTMAALRNR